MDSFQSPSPQLIFVSLVGLGLILWFAIRRFSTSKRSRRGSKTFSVRIIDETSPHPSSQRRWQWDKLTLREMEVAQLAAQGKRNSEIARDLNISVRTVETHLKHVYGKLHVRSRTELSRLIRDLVGIGEEDTPGITAQVVARNKMAGESVSKHPEGRCRTARWICSGI